MFESMGSRLVATAAMAWTLTVTGRSAVRVEAALAPSSDVQILDYLHLRFDVVAVVYLGQDQI